jgi:hypothetical protein
MRRIGISEQLPVFGSSQGGAGVVHKKYNLLFQKNN